MKIVDALESGESCLIHCSDGWDRTPQLASLVQLMVDPHYRTLSGFAKLIEKEFCSFGHKFTDRCGQFYDSAESEQCPVFVQFLDCTWQLLQQFPDAFEFNEQLLLFLSVHVYSGLYGSFLANSIKSRIKSGVYKGTVSIWSDILRDPTPFINDHYKPLFATDNAFW
eukprot:CAMPEP_0201550804 /NCGR_PEP_ID=MMETSP0173_2-20130828/7107_1 /ASSEMBLY_ACC=CAM_ASM_000268 /TAXON_ID=218659 /ORGANISM="Vexillifera sp., Strain DIVA3 564/2" /LENGTH=166 /DNA_ID=CAMNT_0047960887 /DNA_START=154 /DNA_END=651 /DNA_ORIENTATION=-